MNKINREFYVKTKIAHTAISWSHAKATFRNSESPLWSQIGQQCLYKQYNFWISNSNHNRWR